MDIDELIGRRIAVCAGRTPDADRAERNLARFAEHISDDRRMAFLLGLPEAAVLFSVSQFLANYCIGEPDAFFEAMKIIDRPVRGEWLGAARREGLSPEPEGIDEAIALLRVFKRFHLLCLTIRYLTGRTDIIASMEELTSLAEVTTDAALQMAGHLVRMTHGGLPHGRERIAIIGMGKIGGMELNYSSDIDLMAVYDKPTTRTSGVTGPTGVRTNRIDSHEYYCKMVEMVSRMLSANTHEGIAFRVDLRLRPQGQKGELAMPLDGYRQYYKTYGRTWERMALIRARPVAGDERLGREFMAVIDPFVWHETMERVEFEEIRALKKKIDGHGSMADIKRGYGGIREAEFFVQVHQLLAGHKNETLQTYRFFNAMQGLRWLGIVPGRDIGALWESYLFLRRVEHCLQMKDDLQTYELPDDPHELEVLGRHMGYHQVEDFMVELRTRRMKVRSMYNSFLGTEEDRGQETMNLLDGGLTEREFEGYLSLQHFRDPALGAASMVRLRDRMEGQLTMHERSMAREVVPALLDSAFASESPDRAIAGVDAFFSSSFGLSERHLNMLMKRPALGVGMVKLFALAPRISGLLSSDQFYLDYLEADQTVRCSMERTGARLRHMLKKSDADFSTAIAGFRAAEELRLCLLYLSGGITVMDMTRYLSHTADLVMQAAVKKFASRKGCAVIAMGKWGGREITVGSDLDLVFVSTRPEVAAWAEQIINALGDYTPRGIPYSIDARLRPDGTRGVLCKSVKGYRDYYFDAAGTWEIQALLRARPVGGDCKVAREFVDMAREVVLARAPHIRKTEIDEMRDRIIGELAHEEIGLDLKYGSGGMGELEFYVQWMQLHYAPDDPSLIVQNTLAAIGRLERRGILGARNAGVLRKAYGHYMGLGALLRLSDERVLEPGSHTSSAASKFMGRKDSPDLVNYTYELRERVLGITRRKK